MGEKLKKFIELYDTQASQRVELKKAALEKFKAAREAALKLTAPVNDKYKTLGELVNEMFPESGGLNDDLFRNLYSKSSFEAEDKKIVSELFKVKNTPNEYEMALQLQKQGGEVYFNKVVDALFKTVASSQAGGSTATLKGILGDGSDTAQKEFLEVVDQAIDEYSIKGPSGLQNSILYEAVQENQSSPAAAEKSPINVPAEKKAEPAPTQEASAVNPEKAAAATKTEVVSTAGQVTSAPPEVPAEVEKAPEKIAVNINLEQPAVPATTSPASVTTSVTNVSSVSKEETTKAETTIAPTTSVATTGPTTVSQINDQSVTSTNIEEGATSTSSLMSMISQIGESADIKGGLTGEAGETLKKALTSPAINEVASAAVPTASVETTTEAAASVINEEEEAAGEKTALATEAKETTINEPATKMPAEKSSKFGDLLEAAKQFGINVESLPGGKAAASLAAEPEVSEQVSSEKAAVPQQVEVSKTSPSLPTETVQAPATLPEPAVETSPVSATEVATAPATTQPAEKAGTPGAPATPAKTSMDLSSLENRLMRIEHILSSTLEVKIVD